MHKSRVVIIETDCHCHCFIGASGLIGSSVIKSLSVELPYSSNHELDINFLNILDQEILCSFLLEKNKKLILIHTAWFTEPVSYWTSPMNMVWADATFNFIENLVKNINYGIDIHFMGSLAQIDSPQTLYSKSKNNLFSKMDSIIKKSDKICMNWYYIPTIFGQSVNKGTLFYKLIKAATEKSDSYGFKTDETVIRIDFSINIGEYIANNILNMAPMKKLYEINNIGYQISIKKLFDIFKNYQNKNDLEYLKEDIACHFEELNNNRDIEIISQIISSGFFEFRNKYEV